MNIDRLKHVLSLPTYTGYEQDIKNYILIFGIKHGISVYIDVKDNYYLKKGELLEGEYYPCIVAHMDTVHVDQANLVGTGNKLTILEETADNQTILMANLPSGEPTGIGGDDKCGIFIALELLLKMDKGIAAFFVEEETGCWGSWSSDKDILKDVGYFIQFDAPSDNWVSLYNMNIMPFSEEFFLEIKPILDKFEQNNYSDDPFTDVWALTQRFDVSCINFFAGYHNMHTKMEYVVVEQVDKAIKMGEELINHLGFKKYEHKLC